MGDSNKNKAGNNNIGRFISIPIFVLVGGIIGFWGGKFIGGFLARNGSNLLKILTSAGLLASVLLAVYSQIIAHEGGHMFFGYLSGYEFVSLRVGSLMLIREDGRIKRKKFSIAGTGGQCLMKPPSIDCYNYPYVMFNLGGVIGNLFFSVLFIGLYYMLPKVILLSFFLIISSIIGVFFAFLNGIPMKIGGIANDGYNAISLGKNPEARRAFWLQLHINGLIAEGMRLKDMPEEWFYLSEDSDLENPVTCTLGIFRCSYFQDMHEFEKAKAFSKYMLERVPGVLELYKNELRCELIFYEIIGECRKEEIEGLYTKQLRKYIKGTLSYVSRRRLMYAYELLVNKNSIEALKQLEAFERVARTYPYKAEIESEREIIKIIDDIGKNI